MIEPAVVEACSKGDIGHVKTDLSKHHARDFYLVTSVNYEKNPAKIQKSCVSQLRSKEYIVKLDEIYLASPHLIPEKEITNEKDEGIVTQKIDEDVSVAIEPTTQDLTTPPTQSSTRPRKPPDWLATEEIERS